MALNLIKKWFIKRTLLSDKDDAGVTKATALDLDAYIQHRIDESVNAIADGTQITRTEGAITNTVTTDYSIDDRLGISATSSATSNTIRAEFVPNLGSQSYYLLSGTNSTGVYYKQVVSSGKVTLTGGSATTFVTLTPYENALESIGGIIVYTVFASDGTHYQSKSGRLIFDAFNLNGTRTVQITDTQNTTAASSGTLSATMTAVDSSGIVFKCSATSSLTETTLHIKYHIIAN